MPSHDEILVEEAFAQRPLSRHIFLRLARQIHPYRRTFFLNLVFTLLATLSQLLGPKFIQIGIDRYLAPDVPQSAALRGILLISLIYLINLLAGWLFSIAQVRTAIAVGQAAMNDLRMAVFEHIQKLSLNYFDKTHQGRIINRADTDIDALDRILTWGANQLLASLLTLVGVFIILLQYDWRLCLAVSIVLPPLFAATRLFHIHGMAAHRNVRAQSSRLTAAMAEVITGVRVVQAYSREDENLSRFRALHAVHNDLALAAARVFHTYFPFIGLMSGIGTAIILGYGSTLVIQHEVSVGELAAFVLYLGMFFGPIQTMGDLYNSVLSTAASAERIFQLLDTDPQIINRPGALPLPAIQGRIVFENVWFRYDTTPPDTWVLKDINLEARAGQTLALVGATGSGKTSIISLVARFYECQRGRILVDGTDLQATTVESLHSQIGIVTQENFLFTGTVMENLKFGRPEATDDEVVRAAVALGTDDIIRRFKDGYQTEVTERGGNLSAGERQLVTFTRALVSSPKILILDEATSAVDPGTEMLIQLALERLLASRTCFVIAHRLSTVIHAQQILVLHHGEIIERGTHDELIRASGHYARLYEEFVRH